MTSTLYKNPEAKTAEINQKIRIGTVIRKKNYYVDLWMITAIEDANDGWRGANNYRLTIVSVHDNKHGFYNLPVFKANKTCPWLDKLPRVNGEPVHIMQTQDTVNTYDIANNHVITWEIFAANNVEAEKKMLTSATIMEGDE
ncbi:MAG: hypothetical protein NWE98_02195 [Candidatus Bathyarchaeota archaeon]|nr:hypothetical protein [Candidatus Bathyarchaeota archaeon]